MESWGRGWQHAVATLGLAQGPLGLVVQARQVGKLGGVSPDCRASQDALGVTKLIGAGGTAQ